MLYEKQINELPRKIREQLPSLRDYYHAGEKDRLLGRWQLGREVHRYHNDPAKYGKKCCERLAGILGCKKDVLHDSRRIYEVWSSKQDIDRLSQKKSSVTQAVISYQHCVEIAKIVLREAKDNPGDIDKKRRNHLVEQWQKEGLTVRELRSAGESREVQREDQTSLPPDIKSLARSSKANIQAYSSQLQALEERVDSLIVNDADNQTPAAVEVLRGMEQSLKEQREVIDAKIEYIALQISKVSDEIAHESSERSENVVGAAQDEAVAT